MSNPGLQVLSCRAGDLIQCEYELRNEGWGGQIKIDIGQLETANRKTVTDIIGKDILSSESMISGYVPDTVWNGQGFLQWTRTSETTKEIFRGCVLMNISVPRRPVAQV